MLIAYDILGVSWTLYDKQLEGKILMHDSPWLLVGALSHQSEPMDSQQYDYLNKTFNKSLCANVDEGIAKGSTFRRRPTVA